MTPKESEGQRVKRERLLETLDMMGVKRGSRIKIVAENTHYTEKTVANALSGNSKLNDRFILSVCSAFNINYKYIMDGSGYFYDITQPIIHNKELLEVSGSAIIQPLLNDISAFLDKNHDNTFLIENTISYLKSVWERILSGDDDFVTYLKSGLHDKKCFELVKEFEIMPESVKWRAVAALKEMNENSRKSK